MNYYYYFYYFYRHMFFFLAFSNKSFNSSDKNGLIKKSMAQNFSGSSFNYDDLCKTFSTFVKIVSKSLRKALLRLRELERVSPRALDQQ